MLICQLTDQEEMEQEKKLCTHTEAVVHGQVTKECSHWVQGNKCYQSIDTID